MTFILLVKKDVKLTSNFHWCVLHKEEQRNFSSSKSAKQFDKVSLKKHIINRIFCINNITSKTITQFQINIEQEQVREDQVHEQAREDQVSELKEPHAREDQIS